MHAPGLVSELSSLANPINRDRRSLHIRRQSRRQGKTGAGTGTAAGCLDAHTENFRPAVGAGPLLACCPRTPAALGRQLHPLATVVAAACRRTCPAHRNRHRPTRTAKHIRGPRCTWAQRLHPCSSAHMVSTPKVLLQNRSDSDGNYDAALPGANPIHTRPSPCTARPSRPRGPHGFGVEGKPAGRAYTSKSHRIAALSPSSSI